MLISMDDYHALYFCDGLIYLSTNPNRNVTAWSDLCWKCISIF